MSAPGPHRHAPFGDPGWEGARNAADLGGLPLAGGGRTVAGRVWRSAAPEWMTGPGWAAARQAGLSRVVDLRNDAERRRRPEHPEVDESAWAGIARVAAPTEDPDDPDFLEECGAWLDHPRSWTPNLRRYPDKFAHVFSSLAQSPGPVLVHCAGGRDRTGLVSSMLLALTGVETEAIVANYEHGFRGAGAHRGHGLAYDPATGSWKEALDVEWTREDLDAALAERRPELMAWVRETDVEAYLLGAGLSPATLDRVRRLLRP